MFAEVTGYPSNGPTLGSKDHRTVTMDSEFRSVGLASGRFRPLPCGRSRPIDKHFAGICDATLGQELPSGDGYQHLEEEIGLCGTVEIVGSSVAVPYISAVAAATAVARVIAVTSGCACSTIEVG